MLKAFWRVAPSDRFSFLAIVPAGVFFFAIDFSSRTSPAVQARRFFALLAIEPPFQQRLLVSRMGAKEKPADGADGMVIMMLATELRPANTPAANARPVNKRFVRFFLARHRLGSKCILHGCSNNF
jgi:hypothetical protein